MTIVVPADAAAIARAAAILREGGLVAFPTETVYGLGADATQAWAVARIYDAKDRPSFNPLIAHVADLEAARREAALPEPALRLAAAFWPGPLTIVAPLAPGGFGLRSRPRRPAERRGSGSRASRRASADRGARTADRGAFGQPVGACEPGDGRACRGRSFGQGRHDPRRRSHRRRAGIDDRVLL